MIKKERINIMYGIGVVVECANFKFKNLGPGREHSAAPSSEAPYARNRVEQPYRSTCQFRPSSLSPYDRRLDLRRRTIITDNSSIDCLVWFVGNLRLSIW
jgi:hypothetical protein